MVNGLDLLDIVNLRDAMTYYLDDYMLERLQAQVEDAEAEPNDQDVIKP